MHATLLDSVVSLYDRVVGPLTPEDRDTYCREAAWVAVALGAHEPDVPRDWTALQDYLRHEYASGRIVVGDDGRMVAEAVLDPLVVRVAWPAHALGRTLTIGLLPEPIRREYGFAWSPRAQRRSERLTRAIRRARAMMPGLVAFWPAARRVG